LFQYRGIDHIYGWIYATGDRVVGVNDVVDVVDGEAPISALFAGYTRSSIRVSTWLLFVATRQQVGILHEEEETNRATTDEEISGVEDELVLG
jgi:hypothetical protein